MPSPSRPFAATLLIAPAMLGVTTSAHSSSSLKRTDDPLRFFEGRTEMLSTVKVVMKRPYSSRTVGTGRIHRDGTLSLVQQVKDEGKAGHERRWIIRQVAPGRFSGTMTEAIGPVTAERVGDRYRFRFRMKGNLSVEQWMTPLPGGTSATSSTTVKKLGMRVASATGTIRRL